MFAQDEDPPPQAGRLSYMRGNVSVEPAGAQDWGQAYPNLAIGPGDRFYTDANSRAEIQVGRTFVRLGPNSDVTLVDYGPNQVTFGVGRGSIHVRSLGLWQGQYLSVQTPSGTNTVNEPSDFRVDVYPDEPAAVFTENAGNGYVAGADDFGVSLPAGQSLELAGTNPVQSQWLQPGYDDLDQWSRSRDSQVERSASYRYVSPDTDGAYDLDQAGDWTPGTEYGNIWFPHVQQGWQPYHNGHWINRDPWGWVWVEDEQWGYAPFHYGRWVNYQGRWGWIPGPREARPVWSPALVVFASGLGGGDGEMSAWFPLGPGEAYRPWYPASQRYIDQVNISNISPAPRVQVRNTYVNVTNVNVTNITYVNQTTGVTAVPRQAFESGRPVAQAAVRVTPQQMQHVQVMAKPPVAAPPHPMVVHPVAKPVQVAEARPVMINSKGMAVAAKPHAQPAPPPVRQAPPAAAQPPSGRKPAAAPPPNVKMTPTAQKSMQAAAAQHANQPAGVHPGAPAAQPGHPAPPPPAPAAQPGHPAAPAPAPGHPQAEPPARPLPEPQRPMQPMPPARPSPEPQRPMQPMPPARPAPEPQHPAQPMPPARPAPEPQRPMQPMPPARPAPEPQRPAQPMPPARPAPEPQRPAQPMPPARPAPEPLRPTQPMPPARPAPEPQRPMQPMPPARPAPEPQRPAQPMPPARPAPEPQRPMQPMPPARPAPEPQRPMQPMPPARPAPEPQHPAQPMPPARPAPEQRPAPEARPAPPPSRPNPEPQRPNEKEKEKPKA